MRIILTRHCETDWNAQRRTQGQTDIPLNELGRTQAARLASGLSGQNVGLIVSSSLKRAAETAEIVSSHLGVPVRLDSRWREFHFGSIEGNTNDENENLFGKDWEEQFKDGFVSFGGEEAADVLARHLSVLSELETEHSAKTVLLVGHGASTFTLAKHLGITTGLKRGDYQVVDYQNGAAREIEFVIGAERGIGNIR